VGVMALQKKRYTLAEYLELEKHSEERYEFFDGDVFAMVGGSANHSRIITNVIRHLQNKVEQNTYSGRGEWP
jgi:Uma2 family endonuclease